MSGRPIYPVAVTTSRRTELKSWDRAVINKPFGRMACVTGAPIRVAADASDDMLETRGNRSSTASTRQPRAPKRWRTEPGMAKRTPLFWRFYRLLWTVGRPIVPLAFWVRMRRGKEDRLRLPERRGEPGFERPDGPLVWLHAASVGELICVIPLIERIRALKIGVLVTSGTVTAAQLAAQRLPQGVIHQFSPVDSPRYVRRFLAHWQPDLALLVESDLWPNMILQSAERGIPLILVNGRLSQRSFRRWRRVPQTIAPLLQRFDLCLARNAADARAFGELGAPRVVTTGNLKFDVPAPPANPDKLRMLRAAIAGRPVLGAASTHPGEDDAVIAAHRMLRMRIPRLLTLIAPRHPERGPGIAEIARAGGLRAVLRSQGQFPSENTDVYVFDTIGELGLFYSVTPMSSSGARW